MKSGVARSLSPNQKAAISLRPIPGIGDFADARAGKGRDGRTGVSALMLACQLVLSPGDKCAI
jgi:hypothetical protein